MKYYRVEVTEEFIKMLKEYTRRAREIESRKNGVRKIPITKKIVCTNILRDMRLKNLI